MSDARPDLFAVICDTVATSIKVVLPELRECRGMAGRFDVETLKRLGIAAPAVLVSRLGARQSAVNSGPHVLFDVSLAAFVVTKDALGLKRDEAAANICQTLLQLVPMKTWLLGGVGPADNVEEQSLITAASENSASSLWAVTWTHQVALKTYPTFMTVPLSLYVGRDLTDGAGSLPNFEQIGASP